jgi:hypothetical protein
MNPTANLFQNILSFCILDPSIAKEINMRESHTSNYCKDIHISLDGLIPSTQSAIYRVDFKYDRGATAIPDFTVILTGVTLQVP